MSDILKIICPWLRLFPNEIRTQLCRFEPIFPEILEKHVEIIDWDALSRNSRFQWPLSFVERHQEQLSKFLCNFSGRFGVHHWSRELFENKPEWVNFDVYPPASEPLWDEALLKQYFQYLTPNFWKGLSTAQNVKWSIPLIKKHSDFWDWKNLSTNKYLPWNECLLLTFQDKWSWFWLSSNPNIPWTLDLWQKLIHLIYSENPESTKRELTKHLRFLQHVQDFEKYQKYIDWTGYSLFLNTHIQWSEHLFSKLESRLNLSAISWCQNPSFPWSEDLIQRYSNVIELSLFFGNQHPGLPWDLILSLFDQKNTWKNPHFQYLSSNRKFPWNEEKIEQLYLHLDWFNLARNPSVPWTYELVEKYQTELEPYMLALFGNPNFDYDLDFAEYYMRRSNQFFEEVWKRLIKPQLTPEMYKEIFEILEQELSA